MTVRQAVDRAIADEKSVSSLQDVGLAGFERDQTCYFEVESDTTGSEVTCWIKERGKESSAWFSWSKEPNKPWRCTYDFSGATAKLKDLSGCTDVSGGS